MIFKNSFLAFALCSGALAQDQPAIKIAPALQNTIEHLDTDGEYLSLNNVAGRLEATADWIDLAVIEQIHDKSPELKNFSVSQLLKLSGLTKATTVGSSSKLSGETYLNKCFIETKGSSDGLLSLIGNQPLVWQSSAYAPADSDLILEGTLNLRQLPQLIKELSRILPEQKQKLAKAMLNQPLPTKETLAEFLTKTNLRISSAIRLDNTYQWSPKKGIQLPAIDGCVRIDGLAKTTWPLLESALDSCSEIKKIGTTLAYLSSDAIPSPWGNLRPVIAIDHNKGQLWISLSEGFLTESLSQNSKIKDTGVYRKTCANLPTKGSAHAYLSPKTSSLLIDLAKTIIAEGAKKHSLDPSQLSLKVHSFSTNSQGIAWSMRHDEKGLLSSSNSPFANKGNSLITNLAITSSLAGISYGPIMNKIEQAEKIKQISNLKNTSLACLTYASRNNGQFPNNLKQLEDTGLVVDLPNFTTLKVKGENKKVIYVKGLTTSSHPNSIILYSPLHQNNTRIVARLDGSVTIIDEEKFQAEITK